MLTSADVKREAVRLGADLVGIGSMSRFEGTPAAKDPRFIAPRAKSIIGLGFRVLRGTLRGVESGTHFYQYPEMGVVHIDEVYAPMVLRRMACFLEDQGFEGVVQRTVPDRRPADDPGTNPERISPHKIAFSEPVVEGRPAPDVLMDFKQAAFICGLGEIGRGGFFLTPRFGPLQRFAYILTDAELEPDPVMSGRSICDDCGKCIGACPGNAISADETTTDHVAGEDITHATLDEWQCSSYYMGAHAASNPFLPEDAYAHLEDGDKIAAGTKKLTPEEHNAIRPILGAAYPNVRFGYASAVCGRACWRACLTHLEEKGTLNSHFEHPFRP